jgi:hypothetical protein
LQARANPVVETQAGDNTEEASPGGVTRSESSRQAIEDVAFTRDRPKMLVPRLETR